MESDRDTNDEPSRESQNPSKKELSPFLICGNGKHQMTSAMSSAASHVTNMSECSNVVQINNMQAGTVNIGTGKKSDLECLADKSNAILEERTDGMMQTAAVKEVIKNIEKGKCWINIIGQPGEGKKTAAYLAMKHCSTKNKKVFIINTPADYNTVSQTKGCILLFTDMFGYLGFNRGSLEQWKEVLESLLKLKQNETSSQNPEGATCVLSVQRTHIFRAAANHLGKFRRLVIRGACDLDVTSLNSSTREKMEMWKHYKQRFGINIDNQTVERSLENTIPHGFPSCCQIFAEMYSQSPNLDIKAFFSKPFQFISEEMKRLLESERNRKLIKLLLQHDGHLSVGETEDEKNNYEFSDVLNTLKGTYIEEKQGIVSFKHRSFYESAAMCLLEDYPVFVISHCNMSVLSQITFSTNDNQYETTDFAFDESYVGEFTKRCISEIRSLNILPVLSHPLWTNTTFVDDLMKGLIKEDENEKLEDIIHKMDQTSGKSFLFLASMNESANVFKGICRVLKLSPGDQMEAVSGICMYDNEEALEHFLVTYPDFDYSLKNSENQTPEMIAAAAGSKRCSRLLSQKGDRKVAVRHKDNWGMTVLHHICEAGGERETVASLVKAGAKLNDADSSHMWPLHYAAKNGHAEIVSELINLGADVDVKPNAYLTPLYLAVSQGQNEVIKVLLDVDADVEPYQKLLEGAVHGGHTDTVKILLEKQPFEEMDKMLSLACTRGYAHMVSTLSECGADVNESSNEHIHTNDFKPILPELVGDQNKQTTPPLLTAYLHGHSEVIQRLIHLGADINRKASDGCAIFSNSLHHLEQPFLCLLESEINVNLTDRYGNTLLHKACENMYQTSVERLLQLEADVNQADASGEISIHKACRPMSESGTVFEPNTAELKTLTNIVNMLVEKNVDINLKNTEGNTPLHLACIQKLVPIAKILLDKEANIVEKNKKGHTPLYLLCDEYSKRDNVMCLIEEMIDRGANKKDIRGWYKGEYLEKQALLKRKAEDQ